MSWKFWNKSTPSLQEEAEVQTQDLERDILSRELEVITAQHKIAGDRARQAHLIKWLQAKGKQAVAIDSLQGM